MTNQNDKISIDVVDALKLVRAQASDEAARVISQAIREITRLRRVVDALRAHIVQKQEQQK